MQTQIRWAITAVVGMFIFAGCNQNAEPPSASTAAQEAPVFIYDQGEIPVAAS